MSTFILTYFSLDNESRKAGTTDYADSGENKGRKDRIDRMNRII